MSTPTGPAGGDLSGTYPNPLVGNLSHATEGPAIYPAGSAELLTNIPNMTPGSDGFVYAGEATLDGTGAVELLGVVPPPLPGNQIFPVACSIDTLGEIRFSSQTIVITTAGAADAGNRIRFIVTYGA